MICDNILIIAPELLKSIDSAAGFAGSGNRPVESRLVKSWPHSCRVNFQL